MGEGNGVSVAAGTIVVSGESGVSVASSGSGISSMGVGVFPVAGTGTRIVGARVGTEGPESTPQPASRRRLRGKKNRRRAE